MDSTAPAPADGRKVTLYWPKIVKDGNAEKFAKMVHQSLRTRYGLSRLTALPDPASEATPSVLNYLKLKGGERVPDYLTEPEKRVIDEYLARVAGLEFTEPPAPKTVGKVEPVTGEDSDEDPSEGPPIEPHPAESQPRRPEGLGIDNLIAELESQVREQGSTGPTAPRDLDGGMPPEPQSEPMPAKSARPVQRLGRARDSIGRTTGEPRRTDPSHHVDPEPGTQTLPLNRRCGQCGEFEWCWKGPREGGSVVHHDSVEGTTHKFVPIGGVPEKPRNRIEAEALTPIPPHLRKGTDIGFTVARAMLLLMIASLVWATATALNPWVDATATQYALSMAVSLMVAVAAAGSGFGALIATW